MANKTASEIAAYAQEAARCFTSGEQNTLNQAIVHTIKTAGLNPEQVQRVVEQTNKTAYQQQHSMKLGEAERIVEFNGGPARVAEVLNQLNSVPSRTVQLSYEDYDHAPVKQASSKEENDAWFETVFAPRAPVLSDAELDPTAECRKVASDLAHMLKEAEAQVSSLDSDLEYARYQLVTLVKEARGEGTSLGEIAQAWGQSGVPDCLLFVKQAFEEITPKLIDTPRWAGEAKLAEDFRKVASPTAQVDHDHPLMQWFGKYASTMVELEATKKVADDLHAELQNMRLFIRQAEEVKEAADPGLIDRAKQMAGRLYGGLKTHRYEHEVGKGFRASLGLDRLVDHTAPTNFGKGVYEGIAQAQQEGGSATERALRAVAVHGPKVLGGAALLGGGVALGKKMSPPTPPESAEDKVAGEIADRAKQMAGQVYGGFKARRLMQRGGGLEGATELANKSGNTPFGKGVGDAIDHVGSLPSKLSTKEKLLHHAAGYAPEAAAAAGAVGGGGALLRHFTKKEETKEAAAKVDTRGWISKARDGINATADMVGRGVETVARPFADQGSRNPGRLGALAAYGVKAVPAAMVVGAGLKGAQHLQAAGNSPLGMKIKSFIPGTDAYAEDEMRTQMAWGAQPPMYY